MRQLPEGKQGRILAVALLAFVLAMFYFLFVHWWFAAPLMQARAELIDLRDDESRFRHTALQRPAIEQRLVEVREFEANNPGFLPEENFDLAASALIQRLRGQVETAGSECQLVSTTPVRPREEEPFARVVVRVQMRCELDRLLPVLHSLESGSPQLFVAEFGASRRQARGSFPGAGGRAATGLDVAFEMYGYLRQRGNAK